jgi:outer membrane protein
MNKITMAAAIAASTALFAAPAQAGSTEGHFQVKLMGTAVLPDGKITAVTIDPGLPAGTQTKANNNYVPTIAIEYFVTPEVSVETICCLTQHNVDGTGPLANQQLVADAKILPATLTLKYHLTTHGIKPYVGAGATYFFFIDEKPGAGAKTLLAATRQRLNDHAGVVLQAGVDVPINNKGLGLSLDAKRYFLSTSAHWFNAAGTEILATRHKIDPWVLSAGLAYRF